METKKYKVVAEVTLNTGPDGAAVTNIVDSEVELTNEAFAALTDSEKACLSVVETA